MVLCQGDLVIHNCLLCCKVVLLYSKMEFQLMWYIWILYTKAFDSVTHKCLLVKLQSNGITCILIKVFLTGRRQQVVINGFQSDESNVISGVPQGLVLGPLLFFNYLCHSGLPKIISSPSLLFVNDTNCFDPLLTMIALSSFKTMFWPLNSGQKCGSWTLNLLLCT